MLQAIWKFLLLEGKVLKSISNSAEQLPSCTLRFAQVSITSFYHSMFFNFILKAFKQELHKSESFQFGNPCSESDVEVGVTTSTKGLVAPNVTCAAQVSCQDVGKEQENDLVMGIKASKCSSNIRFDKFYDYANNNNIL